MAEVAWPYLLMQGSADRFILPDGAELFHSKTRSEDKTLKVNRFLVVNPGSFSLPISSTLVVSWLLSSTFQ